MADWNQPALSDIYTNFLDRLKQRDEDVARMFDVGSPTNVPTDAVRWNSTSRRFEKWSGAAWLELEADYNISVDRLGSFDAVDYPRLAIDNTFTGKLTVDYVGSAQDVIKVKSSTPSILLTDREETDRSVVLGINGGQFQISTINDDGTGRVTQLTFADVTRDWVIPNGTTLRVQEDNNIGLAGTTHGFQVGIDTATNMIFDPDDIQVRNNGVAAELRLNRLGGAVNLKNAALLVASDGGIVLDNATGGSQGAGSINIADQIYVNGDPLIVKDIGEVFWFSLATAPNGSLVADGTAVSRSTYSALNALYSAAGYPFGNGDGATTFNLPDLRGRSPIGTGTGDATGATAWTLGEKGGEEAHTMTISEMVEHGHAIATAPGDGSFNNSNSNGSFVMRTNTPTVRGPWDDNDPPINGQALGSRGGGTPFNVAGPVLGLTPCVFTGVFV